MTTITLSSNTAISAWETSTANANVVTDAGATLSGLAAAAYSFGKALTTVKYQGLLDGLQLTDARFEFPAGSNQWVSLSEVADALHYKYGVDPLIEFAPGLGLRGYSVADINAVLERLNQEFKGQFSLTPITGTALQALKTATNTSPGVWTPVAPSTDAGTDSVTFLSDPNWSSGTAVRVATTAGGLTAGTDYFVRNLGSGKYSFFASAAAASGTTTTGRIDLTGSVAAVSCSSVVSTSDLTNQYVTFTTDPNWASGTPVRLAGELTDRFVRNLGGGKYSFFDTQTNATGTATTGRVGPPSVNSAVSFSYNSTAVASLLNKLLDTTSTPNLAVATEAELRETLTEGGDLYVDRRGAFFINGVPTTAKDVAVVSRLLAQDNISSEYKVLMDDYTERNNLIASARTVVGGGLNGLAQTTGSLASQYGMGDVLSELTAGQYSDSQITPTVKSTTSTAITFVNDPKWQTGTLIQAITANVSTKYSVKKIADGSYEFYLYPLNGQLPPNPTNPSGISGPFTRSEVIAQQVSVGVDFDSPPGPFTADYYRFKSTGVTWPTGASIRLKSDLLDINNNSNVLLHANTTYYLRAESNKSYGIFDTLDHAMGAGDDGRKYVNNGISSRELYEPDAITFMVGDPLLSDGAVIRIASGPAPLPAGVTENQDYYVRSLGGQRYNLFTTKAAAVATGDPRPTQGLVAFDGFISRRVVVQPSDTIDASGFDTISALLNTLISNKVRDGDLDQAKLQTLTAQLQNNTEAMTAMIKVFSDLNATLVQALR